MNRRLAITLLILSAALSACLPGLSPISGGDAQATAYALAGTQAAQTLVALPTPTLLPSDTPLPTFTKTIEPSPTTTSTGTATPTATLGTTTPTATATATGSLSPTTSATATVTTTPGTGTPTFTPTPGILLYGTVPPAVPYGRVHLVNLSNQMVYISFHCPVDGGLMSYLEFPVYSKLVVEIPAGFCHYIAFIKGVEFTGDVHIKQKTEYTFTFKRQGIKITQP